VGSGPDDRRDDDAPGGAAAGDTTGDRVAAAVEELYGAGPEAFTGRRGELAVAARDAGDRAAAKAIAALRRPTRAAWVVNRLARADPGAPPKLAELGAALRAAQEARHGPRLRELSAARGALTDALTAQALAAADIPDPPPSLRLEVSQTLTAALADPEVAAAFATGTLTRAVQWSGFGMLPSDTGAGSAAEDADAGEGAVSLAAGSSVVKGHAPGSRTRKPGDTRAAPAAESVASDRPSRGAAGAGRSRRLASVGPATPAPDAAQRQAELSERLVREAADRAARRREQYEDAERLVAESSAATAGAVSAEDRLEAEVRDLEQRLTQARADLAAARMRARHAEAADRRARQALDRLGRE
jgi:hypothetical protein